MGEAITQFLRITPRNVIGVKSIARLASGSRTYVHMQCGLHNGTDLMISAGTRAQQPTAKRDLLAGIIQDFDVSHGERTPRSPYAAVSMKVRIRGQRI